MSVLFVCDKQKCNLYFQRYDFGRFLGEFSMINRVGRYWIQARDQVGLYWDTHIIEKNYVKN